jgi:hypothetical protein
VAEAIEEHEDREVIDEKVSTSKGKKDCIAPAG